MLRKKKRSRKKRQKSELDITINQTLIFSATMIIIFTIIMIIIFCNYQSVPDTLVAGFFAVFGVEGGYLTYIHKLKKERENKMKSVRAGDITGFDDAEITDIPDEPDDGDLQIDLSDEGGSNGLVDQ